MLFKALNDAKPLPKITSRALLLSML